MALSIQATPTLPSLDLGGIIPTPTIPPIVGQMESIITSVIDGVTSLIPTLIPVPTATLDSALSEATGGLAVVANVGGAQIGGAAALPTPAPEVGEVLGKLAENALNAFPSMLLKNYAEIQSMASSIIANAATATATPVTYLATVAGGKEITQTYIPAVPTFATTGVINPLSIVMNALPNPTGVMQDVTSVIGGVTSVLKLPALPAPTNLIPLLGQVSLPDIDLPGLLGNKQDACIKDGNGNEIGICNGTPVINDSETVSLL